MIPEDNHSEQEDNKPRAYQVEDDDNLDEKDLQHGYPTSKADMKNQDAGGMESHGMGGQSFGENNITPSGDDPANPSKTAGYANEYFRRTQPSVEHPENNNFKDPNQAGQSNYSAAIDASKIGRSDEDTAQTTDSQGNQQQTYQEGTADDDGQKQQD